MMEFPLLLPLRQDALDVNHLLANPGARASQYLASWFPPDHPSIPFLTHRLMSKGG